MAASALDFVPIGANAETLPANLTEGRFRHFWKQTESLVGLLLRSLGRRGFRCLVCSVETVTQSASGIVFAMLKVRRHAVSPSTVDTHPAMAFGATREAPFVEAQCLLKRDRLPYATRATHFPAYPATCTHNMLNAASIRCADVVVWALPGWRPVGSYKVHNLGGERATARYV